MEQNCFSQNLCVFAYLKYAQMTSFLDVCTHVIIGMGT